MATSLEYIEFVCDQIAGAYDVRYKKMFGEYMVYVGGKPVLLVCDDTVFVKIKEETTALLDGAETGIPYKGAKPILVPATQPRGQRTCYVSDPEGNLVEIGSFNQ